MDFEMGAIEYILGDVTYSHQFSLDSAVKLPGLEIKPAHKGAGDGLRITVALDPDTEIEVRELCIVARYLFTSRSMIYCNGFQSWTESREFGFGERIKALRGISRLVKLHRIGDYHFYGSHKSKAPLRSFTYCYIGEGNGSLSFWGSLSEQSGYTVIDIIPKENSLIIKSDCEGMVLSRDTTVMDILALKGDEEEVFDGYFHHLGLGKKHERPRTGWTSWYNYYTDISEEIIIENLEAFSGKGIPIDIIQIDDGYQTAVGDWLSIKPSFPGGMGRIADEIKKRGYRAGLWLAPFACDSRSSILKNKRHWILKDPKGVMVPGGWIPLWKGTFYCLDIYQSEVRRYLREVFDTVLKTWGYDMVKLDFLYAAAMVPRGGKTRGEIMADGVDLLRELCGKKAILGCGVPLAPAFGRFEYCRIGSDVALKWEDRLLRFLRYRERVSTVNSLVSTVGRRHLNRRAFLNDPDVFILRDDNNSLNLDQRFTLFILNNIFGGLLFTSDNIARYDAGTLALYRSMFPFRNKERITVRGSNTCLDIGFTIGRNRYTVLANLTGSGIDTRLPEGRYFCGSPGPDFIAAPAEISLGPFESRCYLHIPLEGFAVAGSDGHIFPGSEVLSLRGSGKRIACTLDKNTRAGSTVFIRTQGAGTFSVNDRTATTEIIGGMNILKYKRY